MSTFNTVRPRQFQIRLLKCTSEGSVARSEWDSTDSLLCGKVGMWHCVVCACEQSILAEIRLQVSANLPCSHAHASIVSALTTKRLSHMLKSISGRRKKHGCTDACTLGAHVSETSFQETEVPFLANLLCFRAY